MILAGERDAKLLIIDDNAAKKTAKYLGFPVTGHWELSFAPSGKELFSRSGR